MLFAKRLIVSRPKLGICRKLEHAISSSPDNHYCEPTGDPAHAQEPYLQHSKFEADE
jgi:hypothetical protein